MSIDWLEDKRYVLTSIDELKQDVKELKENDGKFSTTLAVLTTKMLMFGVIANMVIGSIVAFVMDAVLK